MLSVVFVPPVLPPGVLTFLGWNLPITSPSRLKLFFHRSRPRQGIYRPFCPPQTLSQKAISSLPHHSLQENLESDQGSPPKDISPEQDVRLSSASSTTHLNSGTKGLAVLQGFYPQGRLEKTIFQIPRTLSHRHRDQPLLSRSQAPRSPSGAPYFQCLTNQTRFGQASVPTN